MKMIYGGVPVNSLKVKHYEMDTNSATVQSSDLQAGVTCFARGQKITGTGKAFSFAMYGDWITNLPCVVPESINTIQIGSVNYPIKMNVSFKNMKSHDYNISQKIAEVIIDGVSYPINVLVQDGMLNILCDQMIDIELFYGKDEYI